MRLDLVFRPRPFFSAPLVIVTLAALLAPSLVIAGATSVTLKNSLSVWDIATVDLNGDAFDDLLVLGCDEESYPLKKSVSVFLATGGGKYPEKANHELSLGSEAAALFLAEVDGSAPKELVAIHGRGATVYTFSNGAFNESSTPEFHSLYPTATKNPIFIPTGAEDMDGDGVDEWLIPVPGGYEMRHGETLIATLPCDMQSEVRRGSSVLVYHRFPSILPYDTPEGGNKGLALLSDEFADFSYGEGWKEHWRFKIPVNLEEKWESNSHMDDINNDGFPDLVVTQTRGTAKLEAQTQIYIATAPYAYPEEPNATFLAKGGLVSPLILDMDSDENSDVLMINVPLGVKNLINFFVRSKVSVNLDVYRYSESGYSDTPDFHTALVMDAPEGRQQIAYTMADFNGDKFIDIAFSRDAESLAIHYGTEDKLIEARPTELIAVPSFGTARSVSLRNNDKKDIILFHPGDANDDQVEVILFD